MSSAPIGENSVMSAIVITPPCCSTLPTEAFAPNVTRLGRWRYFREYFMSETGFPRIGISGSPLAEKVEKAKIVHLAHVLQFAWLHNIALWSHNPPGKAGEKGGQSICLQKRTRPWCAGRWRSSLTTRATST